jgi:hypothetical protein
MLGFRDHFPDQFLGFTVERLLSKHSGRVSSTRRTPFRIPAAALSKGTTSLFRRC